MSETDLKPGQNLAHLLPPSWSAEVQRWFAEDTPSFDWAGFVVGEEEQEAILWGKSGVSKPVLSLTYVLTTALQGVLAGVPFFEEVFKQVDCTWVVRLEQTILADSCGTRVEWLMPEGSVVPPDTKTKVAIVRGKARQLLLGERVALNTLARCSGIATV